MTPGSLPEVAVTGLALVTPSSASPGDVVSGLADPDPSAPTRFDPSSPLPPALARRLDRGTRLACACALAAARQAGLAGVPPERVGVAWGSVYGGLDGILAFLDRVDEKGARLANPAEFPGIVPGAAAGAISLVGGWLGPQAASCDARRAGEEALEWAAERLADGDADAVVVAAGDVRDRARAASEGGQTGEAVAAVVLELPESARGRGARVLGLVRLGGSGADPPHDSRPPGSFDARVGVPSRGVADLVVRLARGAGEGG